MFAAVTRFPKAAFPCLGNVLAVQYGICTATTVTKHCCVLFPQEIVESLEAGIPNPSRLGNPDEFAHLVEHVINNGYINGEIIRIDGALRMV